MRAAIVVLFVSNLIGCQQASSEPVRPRLPIAEKAATPPLLTPPREMIGRSVEDAPIEAIRIGPGPYRTLILGGVHGDEAISSRLVEKFAESLAKDASSLGGRSVLIVPRMNPDGLAAGTRQNARGVDLNRNLPSKNWKKSRSPKPVGRDWPGPSAASEPENVALLKLLDTHRPTRIVTVHAMHRGACNNYDGPGEAIAKAMSNANGYPVLADIGYPTPGSLGSLAGHDRSIATVTLELPTRGRIDLVWEKNRDALLAAIVAR